MSGKLITPCSLTSLMFPGQVRSVKGFEINFPEPLASLVYRYYSELQDLQLQIIETIGSDNLKEIGHHFQKLEKVIDLLIIHNTMPMDKVKKLPPASVHQTLV